MSRDQLTPAPNDAQREPGTRSSDEYRDALRDYFGPGNFRVRKSGEILIKTVSPVGQVRWMPHGRVGDAITDGILFDDDDDDDEAAQRAADEAARIEGREPRAPALPFGQVAMPSGVLVGYSSEAWEIVARLRGAMALLEGKDKTDDSDAILCAMRLLRDAIVRGERLALATLDGEPLPAGAGDGSR